MSLHKKPVLMVYWHPPRAKLPGAAHVRVRGNAMIHAVQTLCADMLSGCLRAGHMRYRFSPSKSAVVLS